MGVKIDMKKGDKIKTDNFLGEGVITEIVKSGFDRRVTIGYVILFDKKPPTQYNMGENPTFMFKGKVFKIT